MKKPVFKMALRDGSFMDQAYSPLIYTRMHEALGMKVAA
jgi:hypothetical protein